MEQYANEATTTLNGAINNSTTTVVVTDASTFPASGNFRIKVANEIMIVTAVSSNTFTVTRGQEGSTAVSHADLTPVYHIVTKGSLLKLIDDANTRGTYASLPAAGRAGRRYTATDNPFEYYDNGSSWLARMPGNAMDFNANVGSFGTWLNQDSATIVTTNGYHILAPLTGQANGSERWHGRYQSLSGGATSAFVMTGVFDYTRCPGGISVGGLMLRDSGSSRFMIYSTNVASGVPQIQANTWSSPTANNSSLFSDAFYHVMPSPLTYLQLEADGTNFIFRYSIDFGRSWLVHRKVAISGSYLASYDQIGFAMNNFSQNNSDQSQQMNVYHAVQT